MYEQLLRFFQFIFVIMISKNLKIVCYLPSFDSYTIQGVLNRRITNSNIRNAGFSSVLPQSPDAYTVPGPTVHVVHIYPGASSLNRNAIVSCKTE